MADEQKNIIISVSVDNTDAVAGIDEVKDKLEEVSDTPLDKPFKNFKAQIKEATLEAQKLEQQFGKNSEEFRNAAKRVAELKDNYNEFGDSVKSFNPDNKLQSLTTAARGAVGAIQGVTGAMAFLGVESSDAQQAIARLQGLMAFSSALDSIDDIKNAYKDFTNILKDNTIVQRILNFVQEGSFKTNKQLLATKETDIAVTNLQTSATNKLTIAELLAANGAKILRAALITTGVGLLVVALGFLVEKMISWIGSTDDAEQAQKNLNDTLENQKRIMADVSSEMDFQNKKRLNDLRLAGASQDAIDAETLAIQKRTIAQNLLNLKTAEATTLRALDIEGTEAYNKAADEEDRLRGIYKKSLDDEILLEQTLAIAKKDRQKVDEKDKPKTTTPTTKTKSQAEIDAEAAAKQLKELRDQNELDAIADEQQKRKFELERTLIRQIEDNEKLKIKSAEKTKLAKELLIKYNFEIGLIDKEIADKKAADELAAKEKKKEEEDKAREERLEKERKAAEEEVRIQEEKNRFLQVATDSSINILSAVGNFAKEGSDLQKGVAIASVVIEKAKSIYDVISSAIAATVATNKGVAVGVGNLLPRAALGDPSAIAGIAGLTAYGVKQNTLTQVSAGISTALLTSQAYKSIQSIRNAGQGGGDNGGGQTPNLNNSAGGGAPQIVATQTAPQAIQDVRVTNQGQVPIRAFITDRDLRSNEQRTNFLNNLSTF
jgi:hypothetical protein